ncbi:ATP-dependent DNA helicase MER3 [Terramyces sp. JEL0728]|nr:ATP-dependent DNA helicase MER3 [Terramyces sp. JEL0728]
MDDFNHLDGIGTQELHELFPELAREQDLQLLDPVHRSCESNQRCQFQNAQQSNNVLGNTHKIKTSSIANGSFFKFEYFNEIQTKSFDIVYNTRSNFLLVAPTGSGKTVIFELAILSLLRTNTSPKIVYIAPTKALCQERFEDWQKRFSFQVSLITGDVSQSSNYNLLVTTPEKFDSITRTSSTIFHLVLVDEIHFIKDRTRGSCLEVLLTNLEPRIISVSATISNIHDISIWLNAKLLYFGQEYRPVQLQKHVFGFPVNNTLFAFEDGLKYKLFGLISTYWQKKPVLVFCCTRKSVVSTAEYITTQTNMFTSCDAKVVDKKLGLLLRKGVGFHHGGLCYNDRKIVEELFLTGKLLCLFTTTTLAVGVNLPAHLVIIKGTMQYNFNTGKLEEYSDLDLLQMIGRAGRPQFDNAGTVVILTTSNRKKYIEDIADGKDIIESSLHLNLIEHLNTQIFKQTIASIETAMEWLKATFLYLRIQKNPGYYQFKNIAKEDGLKTAENRLVSIYNTELSRLVDAGFVKTNPDRSIMSVTKYGDIMSRYYLKFQTVVNFTKLSDYKQQKVFNCLCKAQEFDEIRFHSDKAVLNQINKLSGIKYPIKGKVTELWQKVSLCLQVSIGNISLSDIKSSTIQSDITSILSIAKRLLGGMKSIFIEKGEVEGKAIILNLGVGLQFCRKLELSKVFTFEDLQNQSSQNIESMLGTKILASVNKIPRPFIQIHSLSSHEIAVGLENPGTSLRVFKSRQISFQLVIYSSATILKQTNLTVNNLISRYTTRVKSPTITVELICNDYVGIDIIKNCANPETSKFFKSTSIEFEGDDIWNSVNFDDLMDMADEKCCNHKCVDKSKCAHKCCNDGVSQRTLKKRQASRDLENLIDIDNGQPNIKKNSTIDKADKTLVINPKKRLIATFEHYNDSPFSDVFDQTMLGLDSSESTKGNAPIESIENNSPKITEAYSDLFNFNVNTADFDDIDLQLSDKARETYNKLHGISSVPRSESTDPDTVPLLPSKVIGLQALKEEWNDEADELASQDDLAAIISMF